MMRITETIFSKQVVVAFSAIALGLPSNVQPLWAQSPEQPPLQDTQIIYNAPTPPQKGSPSGRQRGGASRGPCRQFESLTALVPTTQGRVWGQTASDRPTFWFYLPSALTEKTPIEFVVQDADDNYVYNTRITAPNTQSGLIHIPMPSTAKPLEIGKSYNWTLSVYCDPAKPSSSVFVKGGIQRVMTRSDLQRRLANASPLTQANLYATNGMWYDAFNTLTSLYQGNSRDRAISSAWENLLQQVNLDRLKTAPMADCCTTQTGR